MRDIFEGLKKCNNLSSFYLDHNLIGKATSHLLGLQHCKNMEMLKLGLNLLGDEGAASLAEGLKYCKTLLSLHLDHNLVCDDGAISLSNTTLNLQSFILNITLLVMKVLVGVLLKV